MIVIKKAIFKKLLIVLLSVICILPSFNTTVNADSLKSYNVDVVNNANASVNKYIHSLRLDEESDGTYSCYVNNIYLASKPYGDLNFVYSPASSVTVNINFDLVNKNVDFYVYERVQKNNNSSVTFQSNEDGTVTAIFNPTIGSSSGEQRKTVAENGGVYDFGTFYATIFGGSYSFAVKLDSNANKAYIIPKTGTKLEFNVSPSNVTKLIYYEYHTNLQPLELEYQEKVTLKKYSLEEAASVTYSDSDFRAAVQGKTITLRNVTTNETVTLALTPTIGYWTRDLGPTTGSQGDSEEGTGTYGEHGGGITVVCQWWDTGLNGECTNVRRVVGTNNRLFSFRALSGKRKAYDTYNAPYLKKTFSYNDSGWSTETDTWHSLREGEKAQYKYSTASYSNWSGWTIDRTLVDDCEDNFDCSWKSKNFYRAREIIWSDYDTWSTSTPPSYACGIGCEYKSGTQYRYRTKTWSDYDVWSTASPPSYACADGCEYKSRTGRNPECGVEGVTYTYSDYGSQSTSKYGYTSQCIGATVTNSLCGIKDYTYGGWTGYKTSKTGYTSYCKSRSGRNSECGTENKSCTQCYSCKTRTCKKTILGICTGGYTYSNCSTTYGSCAGSYNQSKSTVTSASCGTQNKNCTSYNCPTTRSPNYNSCTVYNCPTTRNPVTLYKSCTSRSYRYASWSTWSRWHDPGEPDYTVNPIAHLGSSNVQKETQNVRSYRYGTGYTNWSDYIYENCPSGQYVVCDTPATKYATRMKIWSNWSSWYDTSSKQSASSDKKVKFRFNLGKFTAETKYKVAVKSKEVNIEDDEAITYNNAHNKQDGYTKDWKINWAAGNYKTPLDNETNKILFTTALVYSENAPNTTITASENVYVNAKKWVPYFYIADHWRAVEKEGEYEEYRNASAAPIPTTVNNTEHGPEDEDIDVPIEDPIEADANRNTKVIYFDYRKPLTNYQDELPDNWKGYERLLEEIKQTNTDEYIIRAELSKQDLIDMREYLRNGGYNDENCEFLKKFAYIFKTQNSDLSSFLSGAEGCKIK